VEGKGRSRVLEEIEAIKRGSLDCGFIEKGKVFLYSRSFFSILTLTY
jgi:hypothetical protein